MRSALTLRTSLQVDSHARGVGTACNILNRVFGLSVESIFPLRKHAYSNILKILQPEKETFKKKF